MQKKRARPGMAQISTKTASFSSLGRRSCPPGGAMESCFFRSVISSSLLLLWDFGSKWVVGIPGNYFRVSGSLLPGVDAGHGLRWFRRPFTDERLLSRPAAFDRGGVRLMRRLVFLRAEFETRFGVKQCMVDPAVFTELHHRALIHLAMPLRIRPVMSERAEHQELCEPVVIEF